MTAVGAAVAVEVAAVEVAAVAVGMATAAMVHVSVAVASMAMERERCMRCLFGVSVLALSTLEPDKSPSNSKWLGRGVAGGSGARWAQRKRGGAYALVGGTS
ncbi:hypothetical protein GCM10009826_36920 [Humibacillus xanthopallidus]